MRRPIPILAVAGLVLAAAPAPGQQSADSVRIAVPGVAIERLDLTGTPVVEARITVADAAGAWIQGLRPDEFDVRLDGRPVTLGGDRARLASRFVDGEYLTVLAVVDVSGSMRAALPHVRAALADFAARLGEKDEIGLVTVADAPRIPLPPGAGRERLAALVDSLPIGGHTAILDAVVAGLDSLAARPAPRRALIVLTDGVDNRSAADVDEAAAAARDHGIPVYAIALGARADTAAMAALAGASGGRLLRGADPAELRRIYSDLAGLLESEYRLVIRLDDPEVGRWHRLSVALRPAPPGVPARAERPFLATRTPGVARDFVSGARARRGRGRLLRLWGLAALVALVPVLGLALAVSRARGARMVRPLPLALLAALAGAVAGLAALLVWMFTW